MGEGRHGWWHAPEGLRDPELGRMVALLEEAGCRLRVRGPGKEPADRGLVFVSRAGEEGVRGLEALAPAPGARILALRWGAAAGDRAQAWELLRAGATDVLDWGPGTLPRSVAGRLERWASVDEILESPLVRRNMVGESPSWRALLRDVIEVGRYTQGGVLLTGESGTGKELVARLLHTLDPQRGSRELVVLDCSTLSPELSGSEFYGHERGAYTGAAGTREGAFALAHGSSLFLDEVGELPLALQPQLLRVIQEGVYKPLGGNQWHTSDFRLICATNRELGAELAAGRFRQDLYFRVASHVLQLPPLRDRREDILPLVRHFLGLLAGDGGAPDLDPAVEDYLVQRDYPGNVRELRQLVQRMHSRYTGRGSLSVGYIPDRERPEASAREEARLEPPVRWALSRGLGLREIGREAEEEAIRIALLHAGGNLQRAARILGVTDRALQIRRARGRLGAAIAEDALAAPEACGAPARRGP